MHIWKCFLINSHPKLLNAQCNISFAKLWNIQWSQYYFNEFKYNFIHLKTDKHSAKVECVKFSVCLLINCFNTNKSKMSTSTDWNFMKILTFSKHANISISEAVINEITDFYCCTIICPLFIMMHITEIVLICLLKSMPI